MSKNPINESFPEEFLRLLHVRDGHFKLESGHHGNLWLDLDRLFLHPKEIQRFIAELAHKISAFNIDAVCGPMVGGALVAQNIAVELGIEFFTPNGLGLKARRRLILRHIICRLIFAG